MYSTVKLKTCRRCDQVSECVDELLSSLVFLLLLSIVVPIDRFQPLTLCSSVDQQGYSCAQENQMHQRL